MGELVLNSLTDLQMFILRYQRGKLLILATVGIEGGMLIIADSTENKYSTIITFSKGDVNKNQIQVVLRNWLLGHLFPDRDITRWNFCLFHIMELSGQFDWHMQYWTFTCEPTHVYTLDNQVRICCLKNFLHTPNFFNCPILVNVHLKETFTWILFTCKPKIAANISHCNCVLYSQLAGCWPNTLCTYI